LLVLDARGLVSAERVRLTWPGLAAAAAAPSLELAHAPWSAALRTRAIGARMQWPRLRRCGSA